MRHAGLGGRPSVVVGVVLILVVGVVGMIESRAPLGAALSVGEVELVSTGSGGAPTNAHATSRIALSQNGRYALYRNTGEALYWQDLEADPPVVVVVNRNLDGNVVSGSEPAISGDGCTVAFVSGDSRLVVGDTNGRTDVFVRPMCPTPGAIERVSVGPGGVEVTDRGSGNPALSGDGTVVAFRSDSAQIVPDSEGMSGRTDDVFVRDLDTG